MRLLRQRLGKNTAILLTSNGGSAVLSFLLSVLIGRWAGSEGLGTYAAALAWIFPLSLLTEAGLGTLITRDVAQDLEKAAAYVRTTVLARLIIGSATMLFVWVAAPIVSSESGVIAGLRISAPLILILPLFSTFTAVFRAHQRMLPVGLLNLGMLLTQVLTTGWWLFSGGAMTGLFVINTLTSLGQMIAAWAIYRVYFYAPSEQTIALLPLLKAATPFAIAAVLAAVQSRILFVLLERFADASAVGYYAAATRFIEAGRMLPHAFFDALFPMLAGLAKTPERLKQVFRRVMLGLVLFGMLFGMSVSATSAVLITMTYGEAFSAAIPVLRWGAWILLPMILKSGLTLYWYAQGQERFVNVVTGVVIVLQVGLAWWIIPQFGAVGAVVVAIMVEVCAFLLLLARWVLR